MSRRWIAGVALAVTLAVPVIGWAHGGHAHKVMGTVLSVRGNQVEVRTADGKKVVVVLAQTTTITRGTTKVTAAAVKPGERVSIDAVQEKTVMMAQTVKLGTAPAAAPR